MHERAQQADLAALGLDWDGPVWRQRDRFEVYAGALARLAEHGLTYECFCSRREIRDAAAAPHGNEGLVYPGTCRDLSSAALARRRRERVPAIRFRSADEAVTIDDVVAGRIAERASDVVLRRNDGVPAYNLAVVVDDTAQGVDLVVRGDDLLPDDPDPGRDPARARAAGASLRARSARRGRVGATSRQARRRDHDR